MYVHVIYYPCRNHTGVDQLWGLCPHALNFANSRGQVLPAFSPPIVSSGSRTHHLFLMIFILASWVWPHKAKQLLLYPHSSVKTMSRQSVVLLLLLFTALLWPGSQHEEEPSGSAGPTCNIPPSVHTEAEGKWRDRSLAKEHPWAEHLTSLPKKEVGALSSVFAFRMWCRILEKGSVRNVL